MLANTSNVSKIFILSLSFILHTHAQNIVFLGDSLTEGYEVPQKYSYPALIEKSLKAEKKFKNIKVINGGISGSTSASGLKRLKWFLKSNPTHMVLALGANDGLRGIKVSETKKNLEAIIELALSKKLKILLVGIRVPPNYGEDYQRKFDNLFPSIARKYKLPFMPFLLKDVAAKPKLNLSDGIHPNPAGYKIIAKNVLEKLRPLL